MEGIQDNSGGAEHRLVEHDAREEVLTAMYITQRRIYDVLAMLLHEINPEKADSIISTHEAGLFATPEPSYLAVEEDT